METIDLIEAILESLSQLSEHFEGTTVYLDSGCAECFQSVGAFSLLLDHGARGVCSLENCSALDMAADWNLNYDDPPRKIVIMTSRLLSDAHRYILRCLKIHGQQVHHCTIFTSISEIGQSACPDSPLGPDAFREYSFLLVEDYEETIRRVQRGNNPSGDDKDGGDDNINPPMPNSGTTLFETAQGNLDGVAIGVKLELTVSVHHFPMMFCPLSPRVFVLPSQGSIAESFLSSNVVDGLCPRLPPLSTEHSSSSYGDEVPPPPGATMTAHFLYHLASKMDLKLEIFSHGSLAKTVGKILTDMSSLYDVGRRRRSAAMLLVDRTLDLLTPCCHGDSLIDRISSSSSQEKEEVEEDEDLRGSQMLRTIRAFETGYNSRIPSSKSPKDIDFLHGSIPASFNLRGTGFPDDLLERRTRDGVRAVRTRIEEALFEEGITMDEKPDLRSMVSVMMTTQRLLVRGRDMSRIAASTDIATRSMNSERYDAFVSAERILCVNARDGSQSLATQVVDLINRASMDGPNRRRLLSLEDALLLTVTAYILGGKNFPTSGRGSPFTFLEEDTMKEAIVEAILENPPKKEMKLLLDLREEIESYSRKEENDEWGNWGDDDDDDDHDDGVGLRLRERVDTLFEFLHRLASSTRRNKARRFGSEYETRSLLHELLTGVFSGADVDELEHHSSTVGRLFKSGFMKFGLAPVKTRLADHSIIIIFIIGGLNGVEAADAQEVLFQYHRQDVQLILGGTTILTPDCMFDMLFGNSSFM